MSLILILMNLSANTIQSFATNMEKVNGFMLEIIIEEQ